MKIYGDIRSENNILYNRSSDVVTGQGNRDKPREREERRGEERRGEREREREREREERERESYCFGV